jgi:hypothetical protein
MDASTPLRLRTCATIVGAAAQLLAVVAITTGGHFVASIQIRSIEVTRSIATWLTLGTKCSTITVYRGRLAGNEPE